MYRLKRMVFPVLVVTTARIERTAVGKACLEDVIESLKVVEKGMLDQAKLGGIRKCKLPKMPFPDALEHMNFHESLLGVDILAIASQICEYSQATSRFGRGT